MHFDTKPWYRSLEAKRNHPFYEYNNDHFLTGIMKTMDRPGVTGTFSIIALEREEEAIVEFDLKWPGDLYYEENEVDGYERVCIDLKGKLYWHNIEGLFKRGWLRDDDGAWLRFDIHVPDYEPFTMEAHPSEYSSDLLDYVFIKVSQFMLYDYVKNDNRVFRVLSPVTVID